MENQIKLHKLHKRYVIGGNKINALDGINLEINKGEFVAIIGPSGSGKSTMMNMIGALDLPTEGEIYLNGKNIVNLHESELSQIRGKKIGFVFQQFNLIPTLTALENVMLPMIFQGIEKNEREKKAEELLRKVGLEDRKYHLSSELSGGQKQRVAIARAMANNPEIIIADEPTGNLDSKSGKEVIDMFIQLNQNRKTIIIVTHNLDVAKYAKKILKMKDGKIENATIK